VHGSDSEENAAIEIAFFFKPADFGWSPGVAEFDFGDPLSPTGGGGFLLKV
jgi:hypothetical protein